MGREVGEKWAGWVPLLMGTGFLFGVTENILKLVVVMVAQL